MGRTSGGILLAAGLVYQPEAVYLATLGNAWQRRRLPHAVRAHNL